MPILHEVAAREHDMKSECPWGKPSLPTKSSQRMRERRFPKRASQILGSQDPAHKAPASPADLCHLSFP